nr:MAG TPA: hypothetical protein [Microviridae sp.]
MTQCFIDQIQIDDVSFLTKYFTEWHKHSHSD